jgi:ADP-ribosylglycohydrolase
MQKERLLLLLTGLAAGDSLGSTTEFVPRDGVPTLHDQYGTRGWPFRQIGGGAFNWRPGAPTDDTQMALCIVRSFLRLQHFNGADVAQEFVKWLNSSPPDIGNATRRGLSAIRGGTPWYEGGLADYTNNPNAAANGSLMRNGVISALADRLDDAFRFSVLQSLPTHYAPLPVLCCGAQTYLLNELLAGHPLSIDWVPAFRESFSSWLDEEWDKAILRWHGNIKRHLASAWSALADADFDPDSLDPFTIEFAGAEGYCLLTLQIAVWAAHWSSRSVPFPTPKRFPTSVFEQAVGPGFLSAVVMIGHDADTYGAAAGPLIAALHGGLPEGITTGLEAIRDLGAT